jgi:hypothetical protein
MGIDVISFAAFVLDIELLEVPVKRVPRYLQDAGCGFLVAVTALEGACAHKITVPWKNAQLRRIFSASDRSRPFALWATCF